MPVQLTPIVADIKGGIEVTLFRETGFESPEHRDVRCGDEINGAAEIGLGGGHRRYNFFAGGRHRAGTRFIGSGSRARFVLRQHAHLGDGLQLRSPPL